jgi:integrase
MQGKITIEAIRSLAPGSTLWDEATPGFGVRRQARAAVFFLKYRQKGIQRLYTIGRYGALTPDQARREARKVLGSVASGNDPQRDKIAARTGTMLRAIEDYLAWSARRVSSKTLHEKRRNLMVDWQPLHRLAVGAVSLRDVAEALQGLEQRSPATAQHARATLSALFNWARKQGLANANPVQGTIRPATKSRERVLSRDELAALWHGLGADRFSDIVRLLVLCGQRRSEIGGLRWSEITGDSIVLPGDRTKDGRAHTVPLSPLAAQIVERQPRLNEFVWGAEYTSWWRPKAALDAKLSLAAWTLHDIRRSVATSMAEIGVLPHIVEAVLNHVSGHKGGVAGIYNRAQYLEEVRAALSKWSDFVAALSASAR